MMKFTDKIVSENLDRINKRRGILESAVQSIVTGFSPALFVWGPPGLGKSHTLAILLDGLANKGWIHHTAYSTPKALMLAIAESPSAIHVFEDCERMLKTDLSASILRAACGAPADRVRYVTWETANEKFRVKFTGAVVIVTNANLAKANGPMQGVASRFRPIQWNMTLEERCAVILDLAKRGAVKGGVPLTAKECSKVAKRLMEMVSESRVEFDLDIRLYTEHALPAFAQAKANPGLNWEDLLLAKLIGMAQTTEETQQDRTRRLETLAQSIDMEGGTTKQKIAKWKSLTELGQAIYYRHLRKARQGK